MEYFSTMMNYIKSFYGNGAMLVLTIASCIILFFMEKNTKVKLFFPIILILIIVINPVLYKYVYHKIAYWRLFWMIPDAIIISAAVVRVVQKCKSNFVKPVIVLLAMAVIMILGTNVYQNGGFIKMKNTHKIAPQSKDIACVMLQYDASPKAIVPYGVSTEIRQYSGDIKLLYGRNVKWGYILGASDYQMDVFRSIEGGPLDYDYAFEQAAVSRCNFVVPPIDAVIDASIPERYGYGIVANIDGFVIYYNESID
ncbi:MAG: hypothetical protein NC428_00935 [Clostridium sp.]|nr:hypothetical protein [Clostridium sp.]